jgi:hypothetical protein
VPPTLWTGSLGAAADGAVDLLRADAAGGWGVPGGGRFWAQAELLATAESHTNAKRTRAGKRMGYRCQVVPNRVERIACP